MVISNARQPYQLIVILPTVLDRSAFCELYQAAGP
jgi:hypothetical protein